MRREKNLKILKITPAKKYFTTLSPLGSAISTHSLIPLCMLPLCAMSVSSMVYFWLTRNTRLVTRNFVNAPAQNEPIGSVPRNTRFQKIRGTPWCQYHQDTYRLTAPDDKISSTPQWQYTSGHSEGDNQ